jgi:ribonuclease PH
MRLLNHQGITVDCDVLQADGGTRTAAINGGGIALHVALRALVGAGRLARSPITTGLVAVSVGIVDGQPLLDLAYDEDSRAQVDLNVVMTTGGRLVEIQGTAESGAFTRQELGAMLDLAEKGCQEIARWREGLPGLAR